MIRVATPIELDQIYMMGFDVWSDGLVKEDYLTTCRNSEKYKRGIWYVLEDKCELVCSLIIYQFSENCFGIGSIATLPTMRKQGYAARLIEAVLKIKEEEIQNLQCFLYADISAEFYKKFGFGELPKEMQRYKTTTCMVRGAVNSFLEVPTYF